MGRRSLPELSIVLPYLSSSSCIETCLTLLHANTRSRFEICSVVDVQGAYDAYNDAAQLATGKLLVFLNDDMFVPPDWDLPFVRASEEKCILTNYLVESGRLPVNHRNVHMDFGRDSASFDAGAFNTFASEYAKKLPPSAPGLGWYMPFAIQRPDWLPFGTKPDFPNDFILFGIFAARGYRFLRVNSLTYHLQKMSES